VAVVYCSTVMGGAADDLDEVVPAAGRFFRV
jgi:hypothetical protein